MNEPIEIPTERTTTDVIADAVALAKRLGLTRDYDLAITVASQLEAQGYRIVRAPKKKNG